MVDTRNRRLFLITGTVQGVGFRPFVFRLAKSHGLDGWVRNDTAGVQIDVEGPIEGLEAFTDEQILQGKMRHHQRALESGEALRAFPDWQVLEYAENQDPQGDFLVRLAVCKKGAGNGAASH